MSADVQVRPVDEPLTPPFGGAQIWEPAIDAVYPYIERMSLLVGRWGFKKGELPEAEYRKLLDGRAQAQFERLMRENKMRRLFVPRAAVAWHSCRPEGDALIIYPHGGGEPIRQDFPRQQINEKLCISDFFREEGDILGCFTVTVGSAEAEWAHIRMLEPLGGRQGARFGPGYPSCPDTALTRTIAELTEAHRIGVKVTDSNMLEPEMSTSAILAHRPRARIFNRLV